MTTETIAYDTTEHLRSPEDIALFIEAVLDDGDPALIRHAIGVVARARGMTQVARDAGLSRKSLCKAPSSAGDPSLDTISRVLRALGVRPSATPLDPASEASR